MVVHSKPSNRVALTDAKIKKLHNDSGKPVIFWDKGLPGFGVKVTPANHRSYLVQVRVGGRREFKRSLGDCRLLIFVPVRNVARALLAHAKSGTNPFDETSKQARTFNQLCDQYLEQYARKNKAPSSIKGDESLIQNHILQFFKNHDPERVTKADVLCFRNAVRDGITARKACASKRTSYNEPKGGEGVANRCLSLLSKIFNFAIDSESIKRTDNPVQRTKKFQETRKTIFLKDDEVARLRLEIRRSRKQSSISTCSLDAIELLFLTGARKSEIQNLRWDEIFGSKIVKKVAKTKNREIQLPARAVAIIERRSKTKLSGSIYVFESWKKPGVPQRIRNGWQKLHAAARLRPEITLHTLRHTFATIAILNGESAFSVKELLVCSLKSGPLFELVPASDMELRHGQEIYA